MATNEYSQRDALDALLSALNDKLPELATRVRTAIDVGKDVEEVERPTGGRRKVRSYRKAARLSDEEALRAAVEVLQAYFVEQPQFVSSATQNFRLAALGGTLTASGEGRKTPGPAANESAAGLNEEKVLEVELRAETQITAADLETQILEPKPDELVREQMNNLEAVCTLMSIKLGSNHGNAPRS